MTQIDPDLQRRYGFMIGSIPESIRKALDAEELKDRLVMADSLICKSGQARTPAERKRLGEQAQRVLGARPRAATEQIVITKMAKAEALGESLQAEALVRQAREELVLHPPAVRRRGGNGRRVAKAAAGPSAAGLVVCYDANGVPVRCGRLEDHTDLVDPAEAEAEGEAEVAKAGRQAPRSRPGR